LVCYLREVLALLHLVLLVLIDIYVNNVRNPDFLDLLSEIVFYMTSDSNPVIF